MAVVVLALARNLEDRQQPDFDMARLCGKRGYGRALRQRGIPLSRKRTVLWVAVAGLNAEAPSVHSPPRLLTVRLCSRTPLAVDHLLRSTVPGPPSTRGQDREGVDDVRIPLRVGQPAPASQVETLDIDA